MRIVERKPGLNQRVFPVERHPVQKHHALRVDENLDVLELEDIVVGTGLGVELELITQPGTTATQHAQTKTSGDALLRESLADFRHGFGSYVNHIWRQVIGQIGRHYLDASSS